MDSKNTYHSLLIQPLESTPIKLEALPTSESPSQHPLPKKRKRKAAGPAKFGYGEAGGGEKRRKKTKHETVGKRIYSCGCGKSYLSYPALYTHLKQKHDSQIPDGTIFPNTLGKGKKGRPKNSDKIQLNSFDDNLTELSEESIDPLSEMVYYLKGKTLKKEENFSFGHQDLKYDLVQSFPLSLFKEQLDDFLPIYTLLQAMVDQKNEQKETGFYLKHEDGEKRRPPDLDHPLCCNQISQFVNKEVYRELCIFVCLFRKVLNKHGWALKRQWYQSQGQDDHPQEEHKEYCQENDASLLPSMCSTFLTESLTLFQQPQHEYLLLGNLTSKDKNNNLLYLTNHFINWLYNKGFTSQNVNFNSNIYHNL